MQGHDSSLDAYGIVLDGWKLVHNVEGAIDRPEFELFNHHEDPLNFKNVASEHPEIVEKLKAELATWREMVEQAKLPEGDSTEGLPPDEINRLRTLGYIQERGAGAEAAPTAVIDFFPMLGVHQAAAGPFPFHH